MRALRAVGCAALFFLLTMSTVPATGTAQTYTVTDLGVLGGTQSAAYGINASGQISGWSSVNGSSNIHATIYSGGKLTDLGTLGGEYSLGLGINDAGQVTGYSTLADGTYRAFVYANGKMTNIGTLGANYSAGYGINNAGQIVGASVTSSNMSHGFIYTNGTFTDPGTLGANVVGWSTQVSGINALGAAVGYSYLTNGEFHGFLFVNGKMTDLGTLGGEFSQAYAINTSGQITGTGYVTGDTGAHAFIYSNGKMTDIGKLTGFYATGYGINSAGVVVGTADVKSSSEFMVYHACVNSGSKMQDLNGLIPRNSGWVLQQANGINDSGSIAGYGTFKGNQHGFLLTPKTGTR